MSSGWYVVLLCVLSAAILVIGQWYVRRELRVRRTPPPTLVLWLGYVFVAAVVIFGVARTSWVVLS